MRNMHAAVSSVFLLTLYACLQPCAFAASWYVDGGAGGSSHNGTSWATAWSSFSTVAWSGINPGDTLYISGGSISQTYTETWSVGKGGTATSPITISVGQDSGHNGTVIFDYNGLGDNATATGIAVNGSYVVITGAGNGASHLQINNLRNILNRMAAVGIDATSRTGITIDHVTFVNDNNPLRMTSATGFTIRNSSFQQVRGDAAIAVAGSSGSWDANQIFNNYIETMSNWAIPPGGSGSYNGPDGVQGSDGLSIYNNVFKEIPTTQYTSSQHPDMMQITGNYIKVYQNEMINEGDSVFDYDCWANANPHDIWVYDNYFHVVTSLDPYPEFFRMYASSNSISSISNVKIMNNTIVDAGGLRPVRIDTFNGNPNALGNEIKNNIFYNSGNGTYNTNIYIADSANFDASSFEFDGNDYYDAGGPYIYFRGTVYKAAAWVSANEPHGKTLAPSVVSYSANSAGNDFHLQATDTVARDAGVSLSEYFTTDKDAVTRPQGPAWDIGAYEFRPSTVVVPPTDVNAIAH